MILFAAADAAYFGQYFDLWAGQANKFYPDMPKYVAVHGPTRQVYRQCAEQGVECADVTASLPANPVRKHFYLLRWLNLPYHKNTLILETQINCLAVKTQVFAEQKVEHLRIARLKRGVKLGGVSAAVFTPQAARKVVDRARIMIQAPPENDHPMNKWQVRNLTHENIKAEQQFKAKGHSLDDETCWITAGTSAHYTAEEKLEMLRHYI